MGGCVWHKNWQVKKVSTRNEHIACINYFLVLATFLA